MTFYYCFFFLRKNAKLKVVGQSVGVLASILWIFIDKKQKCVSKIVPEGAHEPFLTTRLVALCVEQPSHDLLCIWANSSILVRSWDVIFFSLIFVPSNMRISHIKKIINPIRFLRDKNNCYLVVWTKSTKVFVYKNLTLHFGWI